MLTELVITGGKGGLAGGILCSGSRPSIMNCLIVGNRSTESESGGGISCSESGATFINCTMAGNNGGVRGAGLWFKNSQAEMTNSIIWGNGPVEVLAEGSNQPVITYTDVGGGWPGLGDLDSDPLFVRPGYWSDPKDATKPKPASDPTAVWVSGDYHLRSAAGRWDPAAKAWINDTVTSPCIDAGDPALSVGQEPSPNGNRINPAPTVVRFKQVNPMLAPFHSEAIRAISMRSFFNEKLFIIQMQIALSILWCVVLISSAAAEEPVYFADARLKAAVEETLRIYDPTPTDMLSLTELIWLNDEIRDLTGLEYATNLQSLFLRHNLITDISTLSGSSSLTSITTRSVICHLSLD